MKLGLQLKLKQTLAPQLIQSLKMLQMPILQLEQTLRHELSVNPLLEEVDQPEPTEQTDNDGEIDILENEKEIDPRFEKIDWESYFAEELDYKTRSTFENPVETFEKIPLLQKTLYDHLLEQLSYLKLSDEDHLIGEYIIGNISPRGYLVVSVEDMAGELKLPPEKVDNIVKIIRGFDPPGVGARDLRESLLIQLKEKGYENTIAYRIVDQYINVLDKKSILQI
ncbi:MAG: hypothetical protein JSV44_08730, partial [Candidatus Zixiibacteriota bacterium]